MPYPITVTVEPLLTTRNRLTVAFRLLLAIPHLILVGGIGFSASARLSSSGLSGETGLLGAVAFVLAIISWFTIVFGGQHIVGIRQFTTFYMRWRVRALAYLMLLEDQYPPFGDAEYPASLTVTDPTGPRRRVTVGLRIFLAIPHLCVLFFIVFAWWITAIVSWVLILFTGEYPGGLYEFGVGTLRWLLRVEAYVLLLVDEYPPFSLS
ncbi:MAG: DUF4389 domain-containing protein [Acidobacteria bacterium]|nr:DUF4389 domain-containing protein [Acidobacteriota bacterium]